MENVLVFPKRPRPRAVPLRTPQSAANVASMAKAATDYLTRMEAEKARVHEKVRAMSEAAENARRALRQLHFVAVAHSEREWALRVIQAEMDAIKDGIERGDE